MNALEGAETKTRQNDMWFQVTVIHVITCLCDSKDNATFVFGFADSSHFLLVIKSLGLTKTQNMVLTFMISGLQCGQTAPLNSSMHGFKIFQDTRSHAFHNSSFGPRTAKRYTSRKNQGRKNTATKMCRSYSMELASASPFS